MTALICGSMAYDTVMTFEGRFREHILPDRIHVLNVSFLVPSMRRNFGGCAGNIAYSLKLLGGEGLVMAAVGHDFGPYAEWLARHGLAATHIRVLPDQFTAQAFITTDLDNNQITAFHAGAMNFSHLNRVGDITTAIKLGIVGPESRQAMLEHAEQFAEAGVPFIFDLGQGLPLFNGEELRNFIARAAWVALNDYEASVVAERSGWSLEEIGKRVRALIVTRGAEGSWIFTGGKRYEIPPVAAKAVDPTGCGDAYRAGLLYGLENGLDWETTGRVASLIGAIKIEHHGPQQHHFSIDEFKERFRAAFGRAL
jgi:adenosine kinase